MMIQAETDKASISLGYEKPMKSMLDLQTVRVRKEMKITMRKSLTDRSPPGHVDNAQSRSISARMSV